MADKNATKLKKGPNMNSADQQPPSLSKFLYKALIFVVVIIVVPLFPSRAPDFINQTLFTRGWELLHLLFVGIAVCYGLFSRRNDEDVVGHKEGTTDKVENAEAYVSRLLQVQSVFDDESETLESSSRVVNDDESRVVESWSSKYSRSDPPVVVMVPAADDQISSSNGDSTKGVVNRSIRTRVRDKPLLLPVRSLKSRVLDQSGGSVVDHQVDEDESSNVVLRSPIPWRSRSGRMEMKDETEAANKVVNEYVSPNRSVRSINRSESKSSKSSSPSSSIDLSPRPSGYTHSVSPEKQAKDVEDGSRRKGLYKPSPPPAPPLPPPTYHKSTVTYSSSDKASEKDFKRIGSDKLLKGSRTDERRDSNTSVREELIRRMNARKSSSNLDTGPIVGRSVRTARSSDSLAGLKEPQPKENTREKGNESYCKDVMEAPKERTGPKSTLTNQQRSMYNQKSNREIEFPEVPMLSRFSDSLKDGKEVPKAEDIVTVESDSESESEEEYEEEEEEDKVSETLKSFRTEKPQPDNQSSPDFGPDVDKKADEFIAKFREQIRLQRIESIKRSTYQATRNVT